MRKKRIVVLVCGYGYELRGAYEKYLSLTADYVRIQAERVKAVIICDFTRCDFTKQKIFSGRNGSGSPVIRKFLENAGILSRIFEEKDHFTGLSIMEGAQDIMSRFHLTDSEECEIVIFSDAEQAKKLKSLAKKIFKNQTIRIKPQHLL